MEKSVAYYAQSVEDSREKMNRICDAQNQAKVRRILETHARCCQNLANSIGAQELHTILNTALEQLENAKKQLIDSQSDSTRWY